MPLTEKYRKVFVGMGGRGRPGANRKKES